MPFEPQNTGDTNENSASGYSVSLTNGGLPSYEWSFTVQGNASDPTTSSDPNLSKYQWLVQPANAGERAPRDYAVYVWLPIGPTVDDRPTGSGQNVFPQRYYVYRVTFSGGTFVDIVDTFKGGNGWIRLGNGGAPTTRTFAYDGSNPIKVELFNTVPIVNGGYQDPAGTTVVYADAVEAIPLTGTYTATPVVSQIAAGDTRVTRVINQQSTGTVNGNHIIIQRPVVYSENFSDGAFKWSWSPADILTSTTNVDNTAATPQGSWANGQTTASGFVGTDYAAAPIVTDISTASDIIYTPTLKTGTYQIVAWIPGNSNGVNFATGTTYEIDEGSTINTVTIDQSVAGGWVQLGTRRYTNTAANPLSVHVLNFSANVADTGKTAFSDAIRFLGDANLTVTSSPVQAVAGIRTSVGGTPTDTAVTIVADESGRLYCLDSTGDAHGGTTLYWTYPSTPDHNPDPNQVAVTGDPTSGLDGVGPTAKMPSGFNLSSALVERIAGTDYLYIASTNGRVYCIDMAGRGDGTTHRVWTFPDDFPAPAVPTTLGPARGSVTFATTAAGPTVFVPAREGRVYALDAVGNGDETTNLRWAFPNSSMSSSPFTAFASVGYGASPQSTWGPGPGLPESTTPTSATPVSQYLECTAPKLFVPAGANVTGIQVRVLRHATGTDSITDTSVKLLDNTNTVVGTEHADTHTVWPTSDTLKVYGGPGDLWGINPGTFNFSNFGVAISVTSNGSGTSANIDSISVRIFYSAAPPVGSVASTPTFATSGGTNFLYFGTTKPIGGPNGTFYALNADTGQKVWQFDGSSKWSTSGAKVNADDFISGPTFISATDSGAAVDMVVVANENRWISALNAQTGPDSSSTPEVPLWTTNELNSGVQSNLSFTWMTVPDNTGTNQTEPIVLVPTSDGRFEGLFALPGVGTGATNSVGTKQAWEYIAAAGLTAGVSNGDGWLYGADQAGNFYAFGNNSSSSSSGTPPGEQGSPPNGTDDSNGDNDAFRQAKVKFITKDDYAKLRINPPGDTYAQADAATSTRPVVSPGNVPAYDWGETMYILVYNFPYLTNSGVVPPPIVNFQMSVEGASQRNLSVESHQFPGSDSTIPNYTTDKGATVAMDGYAVLAFTLQGGGANALPPGDGQMVASISSAGTSSPPRQENITLDPTKGTLSFKVANPLGVVMQLDSSGTPVVGESMGYNSDPTAQENLVNGSPDIGATQYSLLTASVDQVSHGTSATVPIAYVDRSLMTLIRGPGRGLDSVRVDRGDMGWQGMLGAIDPQYLIDAQTFPNFEDLPINIPNTSLDYPDIGRQNVAVVKDPYGTAENPLFNGVTLNPPTNLVLQSNGTYSRDLVITPVNMSVDVPKYQPANTTSATDSAGNTVANGYRSPVTVFIDSDGTGEFGTQFGRIQAYRSYSFTGSVPVDERMYVNTPSVDLGTLSEGAGLNPINPFDFSQQFGVVNDGNVNLTNVRVAKQIAQGANVNDWAIYAASNNDFGWLDVYTNLLSNIDPALALTRTIDGHPRVLVQKPRVGDRIGNELLVNPVRRDNALLGVIKGPLFDGPGDPVPARPRVTVTVPIGMPVGTYSELIRVFQDTNFLNDPDVALQQDASTGANLETVTEPTMNLIFKVKEERATNQAGVHTPSMIDNPASSGFTGALNEYPAAYRDMNGNLILVYPSNRTSFINGTNTAAQPDAPLNLFVASLTGGSPSTVDPSVVGQSPLSDLNAFTPNSGANWFNQLLGPYPSSSDVTSNFPNLVAGTANFYAPVFASDGVRNFITGAYDQTPYLAFLGDAKESGNTPAEHLLFIATPTVTQTGGVTLSSPSAMPNDRQVPKGRPSLIQVGSHATVFYGTESAGRSGISWATFDGTNWSASKPVQLGPGIESASSPHVVGRVYDGANGTLTNVPIIELSFTGKLHARPYAETFLTRMTADSNGVPQIQASFPQQDNEQLVAQSNSIFLASGIDWVTTSPIDLLMAKNGAVPASIVLGSPTFDRDSGIVSFNLTIGGKAYLDPTAGTVRLSTATVPQDSALYLTYMPRYLRIGSAPAAQSDPSVLYDYRNVADLSFWYKPDGTPAVNESPAPAIPQDRYVVTYTQATSGGGQAAAPYMETLRFGIQLPTAIFVDAAGPHITWSTPPAGHYQVDPARGRIYFTDVDEDRPIALSYEGVDSAGNAIASPISVSGIGHTMVEQSSSAVPIEGSVNESQMTTFLDPFNAANLARPGLVWMFWTSARSGGTDIYFQTIAPKFTPVIKSN